MQDWPAILFNNCCRSCSQTNERPNMIINLKQTEIELALRAYVVAQGISLHGKDLSISFTAGRRESGISAEISIDDVEIPGYTNTVAEEVEVTKAPIISMAPAAAATTTVTPAEEAQPVPQEEGQEDAAPVAEAKPTVSLFG